MKYLIGVVMAALMMVNSAMVSADPGGTAVWNVQGIWDKEFPLLGVVLDYKLPPQATTIPVHGFLVFNDILLPCDGALVNEGQGVFFARLNSGAGSIDLLMGHDLNGVIYLVNYKGETVQKGEITFR